VRRAREVRGIDGGRCRELERSWSRELDGMTFGGQERERERERLEGDERREMRDESRRSRDNM
jgi:hypothetical protein